VAVSGTYAVKEEVSIEKDALSQSDQNSKRNSRVSLLQKEEKMHAFVLRFLKQMVDPAVVAFKGAQAPQCQLMPSIIPGTPATVSKKIALFSQSL